MSKVIGVVVAAALVLAGCGGSSSSSPGTIYVRVAHLSPNAPAVDFCVKNGTGSFTGPVLKGLGITTGLPYSSVTEYLSLTAGTYAARLVAPDAADCTTSLAGLPDYDLPALGDGTYATVAAVGLVGGTPAFTVKPFIDEHASAAGKAALRFIHASPGTPAVDVGLESGATFTPVFSAVTYPSITTGGGVDANGFIETAPLTGVTVAARVTGTTTDALVVPGVSLPASASATVFAIGIIGSSSSPLAALVCVDNAPAVGGLTPCTVHNDIYVRVAHLSPNAPAVDFCLKNGTGSFAGPVLKDLGITAGLPYSKVTEYLPIIPGTYTARLVAPDAADCTTSLAGLPDYSLPSLSGGTYATVAAVGLVGGTPAFTVKPFVDEHVTAAGKAALRFIHASPGTPAVDVGLESGATFTPVFSAVAYPSITIGGGVDSNGYVETAPLTGVTVAARATGTTTDALVVPGVSLPASASATVFAIGIIGSTPTPLKALVCVDNAPPTAGLSECAIEPATAMLP